MEEKVIRKLEKLSSHFTVELKLYLNGVEIVVHADRIIREKTDCRHSNTMNSFSEALKKTLQKVELMLKIDKSIQNKERKI